MQGKCTACIVFISLLLNVGVAIGTTPDLPSTTTIKPKIPTTTTTTVPTTSAPEITTEPARSTQSSTKTIPTTIASETTTEQHASSPSSSSLSVSATKPLPTVPSTEDNSTRTTGDGATTSAAPSSTNANTSTTPTVTKQPAPVTTSTATSPSTAGNVSTSSPTTQASSSTQSPPASSTDIAQSTESSPSPENTTITTSTKANESTTATTPSTSQSVTSGRDLSTQSTQKTTPGHGATTSAAPSSTNANTSTTPTVTKQPAPVTTSTATSPSTAGNVSTSSPTTQTSSSTQSPPASSTDIAQSTESSPSPESTTITTSTKANESTTATTPSTSQSVTSGRDSSTQSTQKTTPDINECQNNPCENGGTCVEGTNNYTCKCASGYDGRNCTNNIDDCKSDPCEQGGNCTDGINSFTCQCAPGYSGKNCSTDINDCEGNPCEHGGTCTDGINSFTCQCAPGYSDKNCSTDIDDCEGNPCEHGGTCTDGINSFTCQCAPGYSGKNCSTNIDECESSPCKHGATCTDKVNMYICECAPGYNDTNCENDIDECEGGKCEHNGTCHDHVNNYTCSCPQGWSGRDCEIDIDECMSSTHDCDRNADCTNTDGGFSCNCWTGFVGGGHTGDCKDIDECYNSTLNPCQNNATCFNTPGSQRCFCKAGWTGQACHNNVNECNIEGSCHSNANCTDEEGSYSCECKDGYSGDGFHNCKQEVLIEVDPYENRTGDDNVLGPYTINGGIPYFGKIYNSFYVSMNGYITLGRSVNQKYPPNSQGDWSLFGFPVIAPLWADIETNGSAAGVYISFELKESELKSIQTAIGGNVPSKAIVVTWKKAVPYPFTQNANHEEADFQVVLCTDGVDTFLMFNYDQQDFTWKTSGERHVAIGYTTEDNTGHVQFGSLNFTLANKNSLKSDIKGRWIVNVTSSLEAWKQKSSCLNSLKDVTTIASIRKNSDPCPCTYGQAARDMRFRYVEQTNKAGHSLHVYRSRFTRQPDNHFQTCHYSLSGVLIKGYPGGGFLDTTDTNNYVQKSYNLCCSDKATCNLFYQANPSDTCSRYIPPTWALSWGDPHITTLDGANYTFNGRGEYTLFLMNNTESVKVQVRTERVTSNNTDATVFVGMAAQEGTGRKIEILLNEQRTASDIYIDEKNTATLPGVSQDLNITLDGVHLFTNNTAKQPTLMIVFQSRLVIQVGVSDILDIIVAAPKDGLFNGTTNGLLGNNNGKSDDDFVMKNGTTLSVSSDEEQLYSFGESWMITETESLFGYHDNGTNYSYFNNDTIARPKKFISNFVENITLYINENCPGNLALNISQCYNNKACIIDTVATCDINFGERSKQTEQDASEVKEEIDNMPPNLTIPDPIYVGYHTNKTLQLTFNEAGTSVNCSTNTSNLTCNDTNFNWYVSKALRNSSVYLKITATGSKGAVSEYRPNIIYCGCNESTQCDYSFILEDGPVNGTGTDNFFRARCKCPDNTAGDYCEMKVDKCERNPCYENVTCNDDNTSANLCGSCPEGLTGGGFKCFDVNECTTGEEQCEQICNNTVGSYECFCRKGFQLNDDKRTCSDKNECTNTSLCTNEEYCNNTVGSYDCLCRPGYARDRSTGLCTNVKDKSSYGGILVFRTSEKSVTDLKIDVRNCLAVIYNQSGELAFVEIVALTSTQNARVKRDTSSEVSYKTDYILHMNVQTTPQLLQTTFQEFFNNRPAYENGDVSLDIEGLNAPLSVSTKDSIIFSDEAGGICKVPGSTTCDPISTNCSSTNGTYSCYCKDGFDQWENPDASCKDVDECDPRKDLCKGGVSCENYPGGYTCHCNAGFMYDGINTCKNLCDSNPCKNGGQCVHGESEGQYVCKCDDKWAGPNCENKNEEAEKLKIIAIAVGASVGAVCLLLLFALFGMYRRHKHKYDGYRKPLSMDFDTAFGMDGAGIRTKDFPIDDDTDTAFSIPRPRYNQNTYDSLRGSIETSESGKMEDAEKPLTKETKELRAAEGNDNPSFLHSQTMEEARRTSKRASKNAYEYF